MRALLVHAEFPHTYWGFQYSMPITGKRATMPPLGLCTVAAVLPRAWALRLIDLNVEALVDADLDWADVVLVGGMLVQAPSMQEVIARAKAAGKRVVVGGPAATTAAELFGDADVVFGGEVEGRVPALIAAIEGTDVVRIPPGERPAMAGAPRPRMDLVRAERYTTMALQTSRGCPYACEFCDVVEIFGRVPRVKDADDVVAELEQLRRLGWRGTVFVVDDNFIGNLKAARTLLPAIARWQAANGHPFDLFTEASVNLAREPELLAAMVAAGFTGVFLGIETPSLEALRAAGKTQNLRLDLREAVDRITRCGIEVMGGFIVGFDSDDATTFAAQRDFLATAPIPMAMVGLLIALPGTALWRRLRDEGRLRERSGGDQFDRPNFTPRMDERMLLDGYADLLAELYSVDAYVARCRAMVAQAPRAITGRHRRRGAAGIVARAVWQLGVKSPRRKMFWSLVGPALLQRSRPAIEMAITHAVKGEHLVRYTHEHVVPRLRRAAASLDAPAAARLDAPAA